MNNNGILSQTEIQCVKNHLWRSNSLLCKSCVGNHSLEIVNKVLTMSYAGTSPLKNEVLFVFVKCNYCKLGRLYLTTDIKGLK